MGFGNRGQISESFDHEESFPKIVHTTLAQSEVRAHNENMDTQHSLIFLLSFRYRYLQPSETIPMPVNVYVATVGLSKRRSQIGGSFDRSHRLLLLPLLLLLHPGARTTFAQTSKEDAHQ